MELSCYRTVPLSQREVAIPRELSNRGRVKIGDGFRSILGSVSLNHILVDLTDTVIDSGDVVEVIGGEHRQRHSRCGWLGNLQPPQPPEPLHTQGIPEERGAGGPPRIIELR